MPTTYYFAGPDDHKALSAFIRSLGVRVIPTAYRDTRDIELDDFHEIPGCYITQVGPDQLVEWEQHRGIAHYALNPILSWRRGHLKEKWMVAGDIVWSESSENFCNRHGLDYQANVEIGKVFRKVRNWIRKNWTDIDGDHFYFGPQAADLWKKRGYAPVSVIPGEAKLSQVLLDNEGREIERRQLDDVSDFEER